MARAFKPCVSFSILENGIPSNRSFSVGTYKEVKRRMKEFMDESCDNKVNVYRHRRGEWGEWFEHWEVSGKRPMIVKQGWQ